MVNFLTTCTNVFHVISNYFWITVILEWLSVSLSGQGQWLISTFFLENGKCVWKKWLAAQMAQVSMWVKEKVLVWHYLLYTCLWQFITPQPYSASSSFLLPPKGPKEEGMQTAIQKKSLAWSGVLFRPLQRNSLVLKVLSFCRGLVDPHVG